MCRPALLHALSGTGSARARRAQMQSKAKKIMRKSGMQRGKKRLKTRGDDLSWASQDGQSYSSSKHDGAWEACGAMPWHGR